ncbi:hypothetical protein [Bradyrhizobium sp. SRS-191]|uniref:hypothetical protein n=1 Tax=Bradyrhizobium sp. SRS-191 TaxID=2962606 RepID=UPI00211DD131|nr:hypothetical protein [Bradyrhizobium sp. SRS-191]
MENETSLPLADWPRPQFAAGGNNPFLFYVVFGRVDFAQPLSRIAYRTEGIPEGVELMGYSPTVHPDVVSGFRSGFLWDRLISTDPELAAQIAAQDSCLVIRGEVDDPPTLNYFRDVSGLLTFCLDAGGVAIYDPQMFKWWRPSEWRARAFDSGQSALHEHVVTLVSEDADGTEWYHTRGLRKFGRPDISVHRVRAEHRTAIVELINRFIELLASGGRVPDGQEIRMHALPAGMTCWRKGSSDDPDFNNEHIEIVWPDSQVGHP